MPSEPLYEELGIEPLINAVGPATRLGGLPLHPDITRAMAESVRTSVRIDELQRAAGREIAQLLGVPGAYVTAGAASALQLAAAVAIAQDDPAAADRLPRPGPDLPDVVVVQATHRDPYDRSLEAAGARIRVIGYPEGTHQNEVARALDDRAAAVLYRPGRPGNEVPLTALKELAAERNVPVIVDGALAGAPIPALRDLITQGADAIAVSGGKSLRGPQASGLLIAEDGLLQRAAVHHQDMDEREATWRSQTGATTPPRHGVGRAAKVGRDQIVGLWAAVRRYAEAPGRDDREGVAELDDVQRRLRSVLDDTRVSRAWDAGLGLPVLEVEVGSRVDQVIRALATGTPRVAVGEAQAWRGIVTVHPMALRPGDAAGIEGAMAGALQTID